MSTSSAHGPQWADAIDRALGRFVNDIGMDVAFGGPVTAGGRQLVIRRTLGARTTALHDLVVRGGTGLGGKAMVLRQPVAVNDYVDARSISHHYDQPVSLEGIHSILAVPLVTSGRVNGILYAALRQRVGIGDRTTRAAMTVARETERILSQAARSDTATTQLRHPGLAERTSALCADLRSIIDRVVDPVIRAELEDIRARLAAPPRAGAVCPVLSEREYEVLCHAALGLGNAEIAGCMGLAPGTVKAYFRSVMRKLDCHNRLAAVNAARALGYDL